MKKVNKSEEIRKHLKTARDKSPTAVVKALKAKGIEVSTGLVSVVKNGRSSASGKTFTFTSSGLASAKVFVKKAGGLQAAKNLLEVVRKVTS